MGSKNKPVLRIMLRWAAISDSRKFHCAIRSRTGECPYIIAGPVAVVKTSQHGTTFFGSCLLVPNHRCGKFSLQLSQALTKEFSTAL